MSELIVAKAGGTSNCDASSVGLSLEWAEQSDVFVPSAPGRLAGEDNPNAAKVTDMLLAARWEHLTHGEVPAHLTDMITGRFVDILSGLGKSATQSLWLNNIAPRAQETARHGTDPISMLGERLIAEVYGMHGFTILDPGRATRDLGSDAEAWRGWLGRAFKPGEKYVLIGNTTRVSGQLKTFSRGGSDTSGGFAAYGIQADLNLNLTDGGAKSADPRLVARERVRHLEHLLYVEGRELGRNGTGLVHPAAMVPLMRGNIPTEIRSTFDREAPYTVLDNDTHRAEKRAGRIAALSLMENVIVHRVHEPGMAEAVGRLAAFETALAEQGVAVIDSQGDGVDGQSYFVESADADRAAKALRAATKGGDIDSGDKISLVTLVGYMLEQRVIDNIFGLSLNSGMQGKFWQAKGYPLSTGRHSLRVGVHPEDARDILRRIHSNSIEALTVSGL